MRRVHVTEIIEEDADRVLLGGTDMATNDRVTFHVKGSGYEKLIEAVRAGKDKVEVELP